MRGMGNDERKADPRDRPHDPSGDDKPAWTEERIGATFGYKWTSGGMRDTLLTAGYPLKMANAIITSFRASVADPSTDERDAEEYADETRPRVAVDASAVQGFTVRDGYWAHRHDAFLAGRRSR